MTAAITRDVQQEYGNLQKVIDGLNLYPIHEEGVFCEKDRGSGEYIMQTSTGWGAFREADGSLSLDRLDKSTDFFDCSRSDPDLGLEISQGMTPLIFVSSSGTDWSSRVVDLKDPYLLRITMSDLDSLPVRLGRGFDYVISQEKTGARYVGNSVMRQFETNVYGKPLMKPFVTIPSDEEMSQFDLGRFRELRC